MIKSLKNTVPFPILIYLAISFLIFELSISKATSQDTKIDSLENLLITAKEDTIKINTLNALAWELRINNPDTALYYATKALNLAKKFNFEKGMLSSYNNIRSVYWRKGDYVLALDNCNKSLEIYEKTGDNKGIAAIHGNIGLIYKYQGDYPKALEYFFNALKTFEKIDDKQRIATAFGNIGVVYWYHGNYPKALEYHLKALKMDEELGNKNSIARHLTNIGNVYGIQDDYPIALKYYFKALKINEETGNKRAIAINLIGIGVVYYKKEEYSKALNNYFNGLKICEEIDDKSNIIITLGNIGSLYTDQKKYPEAEHYLLKALKTAENIGYLEAIRNWHKALSKLYEQTSVPTKALEHYKLYSQAKDSIFNEEKSKDIGKLEAKHEFEIAEQKRIRKEEEQTKIQAEHESRRNNLQYSGILIFLVLVFAGIFMLGKFSIPIRLAEGMIFFAFLLFFEFILVLLDPYIEQYSGGEPAYKLLFNALLAGLIFPLHQFFEGVFKRRIFKAKRK